MDAEVRAAFRERYGYEATWREHGEWHVPRTAKERAAWLKEKYPDLKWSSVKQLNAIYHKTRGKV